MHTTLNAIKTYDPCLSGWNKLLHSLNKPQADDEPVSLMHILRSNGIRDAVWALRCFDYKDYCLFLADVVDSVAHLTDDKRVHDCIQAIRDYHASKITKDDLQRAADAAAVAAAVDADAYIVAATAAVYAAAVDAKWKEIEQLFVKHFDKETT